MAFTLPTWSLHMIEHWFPGYDWTIRRSEWIPCFALLTCVWFFLFSIQLYLNPQMFSLLPFPFSPLSQKKSEWLCGAELMSGVKPRVTKWKLARCESSLMRKKIIKKKSWSNSSHHSHQCFLCFFTERKGGILFLPNIVHFLFGTNNGSEFVRHLS